MGDRAPSTQSRCTDQSRTHMRNVPLLLLACLSIAGAADPPRASETFSGAKG